MTAAERVLRVLLEEMLDRRASDLYLAQNRVPTYRVYGEVVLSKQPPTDRDTLMEIIRTVSGEKGVEAFITTGDHDVSYGADGLGRFRINMYRQRTGLAAVCRHIPTVVPPLEELRLPGALGEFGEFGHGLVIVTGPTGSGKTTTLASLISEMAENQTRRILTIEDPIEFLLDSSRSLIVQREVGIHTPSFAQALQDALREDIDILMVGELRDLETIRLALTAAEMGMLVFCTLHTTNAAKAISRIVDVFPPEEQAQVQLLMADVLRGVLAQQLCLRADEDGRIAAGEILLSSPSLSYLIRENKTNQVHSAIQTGREAGMVTMDQSLISHFQEGLITLEELYSRAHNVDDLQAQGVPPLRKG